MMEFSTSNKNLARLFGVFKEIYCMFYGEDLCITIKNSYSYNYLDLILEINKYNFKFKRELMKWYRGIII